MRDGLQHRYYLFFLFDLWVRVRVRVRVRVKVRVRVRVRVRMYSGGFCTVSGACVIADAVGWLLSY